MQDRTKAQITIGLLAYFASIWVLFDHAKNTLIPMDAIILVFVLLIVLLVLSYIIIAILDWIHIFDLKTNAVLTLIVLIALMINLTIYLLIY